MQASEHVPYRENECGVEIPGGWLIFPAYPQPCDYVRFTDEHGFETLYYDQEEWRRDPAGVMGSIMATILNGPDYFLHSPDEEE